MGTKTTVNDKGLVTESESGTAITFIVDGKTINKTENAAVDGDITVGNKPVVVVEGATVTPTASLPVVGSDNVGLQYTIVNADPTTAFAVSGTQGISGGEWELNISASTPTATTRPVVCILAVSSTLGGYAWERLY